MIQIVKYYNCQMVTMIQYIDTMKDNDIHVFTEYPHVHNNFFPHLFWKVVNDNVCVCVCLFQSHPGL